MLAHEPQNLMQIAKWSNKIFMISTKQCLLNHSEKINIFFLSMVGFVSFRQCLKAKILNSPHTGRSLLTMNLLKNQKSNEGHGKTIDIMVWGYFN